MCENNVETFSMKIDEFTSSALIFSPYDVQTAPLPHVAVSVCEGGEQDCNKPDSGYVLLSRTPQSGI